MKRVFFLIAFVSIAILLSNCKRNHYVQIVSNVQDTASVKAEIKRISKIQNDAIAQHNEEGNRIFASTCEDSIMTVNDGQMMISAIALSHDLVGGEIDIPHASKYQFYNNNTVIVSSISKMYALIGVDTFFYQGRNTCVFVKNNNQWKMAYLGYSPLPVSYYKASNYANVKPVINPNYVGIYQLNPTIADTILLIDGKLYSRANTDSQRTKLFPINDSTFMAEDNAGKMIFVRGVGGKVVQQIYEYPDGQRIHVPKVK